MAEFESSCLSLEPVLLQDSRRGLPHSWVSPCTLPRILACNGFSIPVLLKVSMDHAGLQTLLPVYSELSTEILSKHLETFFSHLMLL